MKLHRIWIICALVVPTTLTADIPESFGLHANLAGRSGAGEALYQSWSSAYDSPAAMAAPTGDFKAKEIRHYLGAGLMAQQPLLNIRTKGGSELARNNAAIGSDVPGYLATLVGMNVDMRKMMDMPVPVRAGVVVALPGAGDTIAKFQETSQKFYDFRRLGRGVAKPSIATSFAAQVWPDRLSVGFGLYHSAQVKGRIDLTEIKTDPSEQPVTETKLKIGLKPAILTGVMYRQPLPNKLELLTAFRYKQANQLDADLDVFAELPVGGLSVLHNIEAQILSYYHPHSFLLSTGVKYGRYQGFVDAEYQAWSLYRLSRTRALFEASPDFEDIVIFRIGGGVELPKSLFSLEIQTGYGYIPAFTPEQTGASNYLDNDKHVLSLGFGRFFHSLPRVWGSVRFDMALQYQIWSSRDSIKKLRTTLPDDTGQPDYSYGGGVFITNLSVTLTI